MSRWEPDAGGRLGAAALELFDERGYEQTTVAEIAQRAGLTKRTFFRHFADKREVLFSGSERYHETIVAGIAAAPESAAPLDAALAGFERVATDVFAPVHEYASLRARVIASSPELRERELIKGAHTVELIAAALRGRGVPDDAAALAAASAQTIFGLAFVRWTTASDPPPLTALIAEGTRALREATRATGATAGAAAASAEAGKVMALSEP